MMRMFSANAAARMDGRVTDVLARAVLAGPVLKKQEEDGELRDKIPAPIGIEREP